MANHIGDRLQATAERIAGLRTDLDDETELRDRQILEALDMGVAQGQVSRWAKIGETRVRQIMINQVTLAS
jgi:hypothetical protein